MSSVWNQDKASSSNVNPNPSLRTWRSNTSFAITTCLKDAKWLYGCLDLLSLLNHFWNCGSLVVCLVGTPINPLGLNLEVILGVCDGVHANGLVGTLIVGWPLDAPIDPSGLAPSIPIIGTPGSLNDTLGALMVGLKIDKGKYVGDGIGRGLGLFYIDSDEAPTSLLPLTIGISM